ncbi:MAG: PorT family protein [Bacteroidetes bacterium]|nr:PorT family protein [Bacteroidota bacterium]
MKKLITIFSFAAATLAAQQEPKTFNLLINAGITACQVHGDSYNGFHKLGGMGGVGVEYTVSGKFAPSLYIQFIQKGAQHNPNPAKGDLKAYYLNLNYVEVPLLFTYKQQRFLFDIGVSAGYLISYYEGTELGNITGYSPFRKMEYSVKAGLGYKLSEKFYANVRSSNSFITIRPYQVPGQIYYNNFIARKFNKGLYNNILEITLGYKIKPKKKSV